MASCSSDDPEIPVESQRVPAQKVSLVYMMGDNSLSNYTSNDIAEMLNGASAIPDEGRLYVFVDRSSRNSLLLEVRNTQQLDTLYQWSSNLNSADTEVMQQVFDKVDEEAPAATSWSLTLWSHGSGWMPDTRSIARSIGQDTGKVPEINIDDLATALKKWHHLDFIFFDACFMQCVETDYELRDVTDYILGSPAEIPGNGAPYNTMLADIFATPKPDVNAMLQHYYNAYSGGDGVLLSACETAYLGDLLQATKPYMETYFGSADATPVYTGVQRYYAGSTSYPPFYDLRSFLCAQPDADVIEWEEILFKAYPYRYCTSWWRSVYASYGYDKLTDEEHYGGVSFYAPGEYYYKWNLDFQTTAWYADMGWKEWGW